jgi:hypothetical protein
MTNLLFIRVVGLLVAVFLALWAFGSFARIWRGLYSKPDSTGKAGFCTFRAFATQGTIALIGAVLLAYLSLRHY